MFILGDLISRLRVASKSHLKTIKVLNTRLSLNILELFYKTGMIRGFKVDNDFVKVFLKYHQNKPAFFNIELISTPGKKVYWSRNKLSLKSNLKNFAGFYIISTSKGLIISNDCILNYEVCGQILLKVYI